MKKEVFEGIDKLTNSIENAITGDVLQTEFQRIRKFNTKEINVKNWVFNWKAEMEQLGMEVYKLTIKGNPGVIQGLLSLKVESDHVFISLVKSAEFNRGKDKMYLGVLGNLFAYACKRSLDEGFGGFVAFMAKTSLIEHFEQKLGARKIAGQRMYLDSNNAMKLIMQYFNT